MKLQILLASALLTSVLNGSSLRAAGYYDESDPVDTIDAAAGPKLDRGPVLLKSDDQDASTTPAKSTSANPSADLSTNPALAAVHDKIRKVLALYYPHHLNTRDNDNWELMHSIVSYGTDTQVFRAAPGGEKVNAIGWMCYNGTCKGERMLYVDRGKLVARKGPGVQGHYGQFLAILAQSRVQADYPMRVDGKSFTIADLIRHEMDDCSSGDELTFKLIALSYYRDSDDTWTASDGQKWSIQKLIREELKQPIRGAACGGSHRLMGFSYALHHRIKQGKPVNGEFLRAQIFLNDYHRYTAGLQNPDGSFSTSWFEGSGNKAEIARRLQTTGHIAEWLSFSLSDDELRNPRMIKAMDYLSGILLKEPNRKWSIGPLGHGLHALAIYDSRIAEPAADSTQPLTGVEDAPLPDEVLGKRAGGSGRY